MKITTRPKYHIIKQLYIDKKYIYRKYFDVFKIKKRTSIRHLHKYRAIGIKRAKPVKDNLTDYLCKNKA